MISVFVLRNLGGIRLSSEAWKYLAVLASISIITMYVEMVVMPSLPTIEKQYGVTESEVSWSYPQRPSLVLPSPQSLVS